MGEKKNTYWNRQSNSHANLCSWHEDLGRSLQASNNVRKTPGCNVICRWVYLSASSARLAISRLIVRWTERLSFLFVVVGQRTFADKAHKVVRVELLLHCAHLGYVSQSKKKKKSKDISDYQTLSPEVIGCPHAAQTERYLFV